MNNQSYLLSERASARVSFGSESSRLSSLGHLQSTEQSPFAAAERACAGHTGRAPAAADTIELLLQRNFNVGSAAGRRRRRPRLLFHRRRRRRHRRRQMSVWCW